MSDCKISRKELETYLRIKELIKINGYNEDDLIRAASIPLIIHSDNVEPK